jgi:hypothetical protein
MISLGRLRRALGIEPADEPHADDQLLNELLGRALAFVEKQTGRYFGEEHAVEEYLTGDGKRNLWLAGLPLIDPTDEYDALLVVEQLHPGAAQTAIAEGAANGFEVRGGGRQYWLVRRGGYVWQRGYEYIVTYVEGYEIDGLPGDIEQLLIDLVSSRYSSIGAEGLRSETIGGYSYTAFSESDLSSIEGAQDTLAAWRRMVFA